MVLASDSIGSFLQRATAVWLVGIVMACSSIGGVRVVCIAAADSLSASGRNGVFIASIWVRARIQVRSPVVLDATIVIPRHVRIIVVGIAAVVVTAGRSIGSCLLAFARVWIVWLTWSGVAQSTTLFSRVQLAASCVTVAVVARASQATRPDIGVAGPVAMVVGARDGTGAYARLAVAIAVVVRTRNADGKNMNSSEK